MAYSPDLPGCIATGAVQEETIRNMEEVIAMHIRGLMEDGLPVREPTTYAEYIPVQWAIGGFSRPLVYLSWV
ncbi:MAG: type II toxin-antitoxin system HicB family antitoxin [Bacillota bacterium]